MPWMLRARKTERKAQRARTVTTAAVAYYKYGLVS
jgi:hypothetical protein